MTLTPEQLANFITWATGEGWDEPTINAMIAAATAGDLPAPATETPEPAPADPAAEVMAARAALVTACATQKPATIQAAQKAYAAALNKSKKPAAPQTHPLANLLATVTKAKAQQSNVAPPAVTRASANPDVSKLEEQLAVQKTITDQLMMKELEREGLLEGIEEPMKLYTEAPNYFMERVKGKVPLLGANSPIGSGRSPLREVKAVAGPAEVGSKADNEYVHQQVNIYREAQRKVGRVLDYSDALIEWDEQQAKKAAK